MFNSINISYLSSFRLFRAIDLEALVGSIGGYIGLCLGYSILQLPEFLSSVFVGLGNYYSKMKRTNRINIEKPKGSIFVEEKYPEEFADHEGEGHQMNSKEIFRWSQKKFEKVEKDFDEFRSSFIEVKHSILEIKECIRENKKNLNLKS